MPLARTIWLVMQGLLANGKTLIYPMWWTSSRVAWRQLLTTYGTKIKVRFRFLRTVTGGIGAVKIHIIHLYGYDLNRYAFIIYIEALLSYRLLAIQK